MNEIERLKQEVAGLMLDAIGEAREYPNEPIAERVTDDILSIKGLAIVADDQSLPSVRNAVNKSYNDYMLGQEDMLKANFVKVVKK